MKHVIVVGGGASGMMAAITAARKGAKVTLIEQKEQLGKKILATGNGRCNFTNLTMDATFFRSDDSALISNVLKQFNEKNTLEFFETLGVLWKERNGYVYPMTDQASTIVELMILELQKLQVQILCSETVVNISQKENGFSVKTSCATYPCDALILATGGKANPALGSDGSGYQLVEMLGHHISPVVPALVQLRSKAPFFKQLAGIRTQAMVTLLVDNQVIASDMGELQLTAFGISGIPVFQISRFASKALYDKKQVVVELDFVPTMDENSFTSFMNQRKRAHKEKTAGQFLIGIFPHKLIPVLLKGASIPMDCRIELISEELFQKLIDLSKHFMVRISETNGFEQAQVCAGGVKLSEVNPDTLESKYVDRLYITGELLDVDAICGGYNLQWAWSTGYIAAIHATKEN